MVIYNPDAPIETWEDYQQRVYDADAAFLGPRQGPDWSLFYEKGTWPNWPRYRSTFIGPRPPSDPYWCPSPKKGIKKAEYRFFTDYMLLPSPSEVVDWIRENARGEAAMGYTWKVKGRRKHASSKAYYIYAPDGDPRKNAQFEKMVHTIFDWIENDEACSVSFDLEWPPDDDNLFRTRFPWRFKE